MKDKMIWTGVLAALPPLMLAAAGWLKADMERKQRLDLADNYQSYIQDQMTEDSSLKGSLDSCLRANEHLVEAIRGGGPVPPAAECEPCPELVPMGGIAAEPMPPEPEP